MIFRQLFDATTSTYTYILGDPESGAAVIIDPVDHQAERDLQCVQELGLYLVFILETHVHADHVTGATFLRDRTGAESVVGHLGDLGDVTCANRIAKAGDVFQAEGVRLEALSTPGHTAGCMTYLVPATSDRPAMAFTGDALLIRGCGRTDFQQGDPGTLYESVHTQLFSLPDETLIYPGHDYRGHTVSTVGEEKRYNPRLKLGISRNEFVRIMEDLHLAPPEMLDIAVAANMACGKREPAAH